VNYPTRDLIDLFEPSSVQENDFIETEHLTSLVVILARGQDKDFLSWYADPVVKTTKMVDGKEEESVERLDDEVQSVVPESAKKFMFKDEGPAGEDKDGNTVWRIVLFKSAKKKFIELARHQKFTVREFHYSAANYSALNKKRDDIATKLEQVHRQLQDVCKKGWSDVLVAWLHVKALDWIT